MPDELPSWLALPHAQRAVAERRYGTVLRLARIAAGLTLQQAGDRAGYSAATLSRIERGLQPLTDVRLLRHFSAIFAIPPGIFGLADSNFGDTTTSIADRHDKLPGSPAITGGPVRRRDFLTAVTGVAVSPIVATTVLHQRNPAHRLVGEIERALHGSVAGTIPLDPVALQAGMRTAKLDFQMARYRRIAERLPTLLLAARADRHADPAVVAELFNTAANVLLKLKVEGSGWTATERAMAAAHTSGDPIVVASVTRNAAVLYRAAGRYELSEKLALDAADRLRIDHSPANPTHLSLYGTLLCNAGYTAARAGDRSRAQELLDHAAETASRLGADRNVHWTAFGPTNVTSHRISAAYALGDFGTAIAHAGTVPPGALRLPERQSRFWVDVARAYQQWGKPAECYRALLAAERQAPEEVRARPVVRELAITLLSAPRRSGLEDIRGFAARVEMRE